MEKMENFKKFIKEISKNQEPMEQYVNLTYPKLYALCKLHLIPKKDEIDSIVEQMSKVLDFDYQEYGSKVKRYLELFIEYHM